MLISAISSLAIGFVVTLILTPLVIQLARRLGWVARPRKDRWHSRPTALMGGIGIFAGTLAAWIGGGELSGWAPLAVPAVGMFLLGVVDDRWIELMPRQKLLGQTIAALMLAAAGVRLHGLPALLALPLTLLWVVGITNAINLLDNMDGLASGIVGIAALVLAAYCVSVGDVTTTSLLLGMAGSCAGFLVFNSHPARIFMGDCGSMFLGFTLAALAIRAAGNGAPSPTCALLVPPLALAIPIFDTTLVAVVRALNGRPIMPGYPDHSSHRLVALGLSERATALVMYNLAAVIGVLALATVYLPPLVSLTLTLLLAVGLPGLGFYLGLLNLYPEKPRVRPQLQLWARHSVLASGCDGRSPLSPQGPANDR